MSNAKDPKEGHQESVPFDDRKLKPSTLMMGYGYDAALSEGALKPPVFLTSTFTFENAAAGKRHFEGITACAKVVVKDLFTLALMLQIKKSLRIAWQFGMGQKKHCVFPVG